MKKIIFLSALMASFASPAFSQAAAKPGNCAVILEETAKIVDADTRYDGQLEKDAIKAFETFAKAQRKIVKDGLAKTYADSKAFGWDKAKVDQMITMNEDAIRNGFTTSTMEDDTLYMDHIIAVNNCAEANKQDAQFGQSRDGFIATLTEVFNRLRMA